MTGVENPPIYPDVRTGTTVALDRTLGGVKFYDEDRQEDVDMLVNLREM